MQKLSVVLVLFFCLSVPLRAQNLSGFPDLEPLTATNINRLELLAMLGRGRVYDVAWSPSGETVAAATDTGVWLYAADAPEAIPRQIVVSLNPVYRVLYVDNGQTLVGGLGEEVKFWNAQTGEEEFSFSSHQAIRHLALSSDESLIATGADRGDRIELWKTRAGEHLATIEGPGITLLDLAFNPTQNQIALVSLDSTARLWDVTDPEAPVEIHILPLQELERNRKRIRGGIAFSADGTLLAASIMNGYEGSTRLWDSKTGRQLADNQYGKGELAFSPDGRFLVAIFVDPTTLPGFCLWSVIGVQSLQDLEAVYCFEWSSHVYIRLREVSLEFSPDSSRLAIADVGDVQIFNPLEENPRLPGEYEHWQPFDASIEQITFTADGASLFTALDVSTSYPSRRIWDLATGQEQILEAPPSTLVNERLSEDGRFGVSYDAREPNYEFSPETTVKLWDESTDTIIARLELNVTQIMNVAFSPDSRLLATAGRLPWSENEMGVRLWSLPEGDQTSVTEVAALPGTDEAWSVAWGADSQLLVVVDGGEVEFYRYTDETLLQIGALPFTGHSAEVISVAISTDKTLLATGGYDNVIRLWGVPANAD